MKGIKKTICLLLSLIMILSMGVPAFAFDNATNEAQANTTTSEASPISIELSTDKSSYSTTGIAKITAKVTNTSGKDIKNVSAEAVFTDLAPVKNGQTTAEAETLKDGESLEFTYSATINKNAKKLNIFEKIILWFVRIFNGGYSAKDNGFDNGREYVESYNDIKFGKHNAVNGVKVWFGESDFKFLDFYASDYSAIWKCTNEITFYASVNSKSKIGNDEIMLYSDKGKIGYLKDDGTTGDEYANDNIFSGTFQLSNINSEEVRYYAVYHSVISEDISINFHEEISKVSLNQNSEFCSLVNSIVFANNKEIQEKFNELISFLDISVNQGKIASYDIGNSGVMIRFNDGSQYLYYYESFNPKSSDTNKSRAKLTSNKLGNITANNPNSEIIVLSPFYNSMPYKYYETATKILETVPEYSSCGEYINENVTLDVLKTLDNYKVIILSTHGGFCGQDNNDFGFLYGTPYDEETKFDYIQKYMRDYSQGNIYVGVLEDNSTYWGVKTNFFRNNFNANSFDDALVYMGACHGADNNALEKVLRQKGVSSIFAYSGSVPENYDFKMYESIFDNLLTNINGEYVKASNALVFAKAKNGANSHQTGLGLVNVPGLILGLVQESAELHLLGNQDWSFSNHLTHKGQITGYIKEEKTSISLENITIYAISANAKKEVKTNSNGKFTFNLPAGTWEISVEDTDTHWCNEKRTITVERDEEVTLTPPFYMKKGTKVQGSVLDSTTKAPVANATVEVFDNSDVNIMKGTDGTYDYADFKKCELVTTTTTDENGKYTLNLQAEKNYAIAVNCENYKFNGLLFYLEKGLDGYFPADILLVANNDRTVTASGNCGAQGDNVKWVLYDDGELVISGSGKMQQYTVTDYNVYYGNTNICAGYTSAPWFNYIDSIVKITINNSVTSIGEYAFALLDKITSVSISKTVKTIDSYAFGKCLKLENVYFQEKSALTNIMSCAFDNCKMLKSINLQDCEELSKIGYYAFNSCVGLKKIVITKNITNLGEGAFANCYGLNYIEYNIPNLTSNCENIFTHAGKDSRKLDVIFTDTVIKIPDYLFEGFSYGVDDVVCRYPYITSVEIGKNVTTIGNGAFYFCNTLRSIYIPSSVENISFSAFMSCSNLETINVDTNNKYYSSINGVLFDKNHTTLICFPNKNAVEYIVPDGVKTIGCSAFFKNNNLTKLTLPISTLQIDDSALYYCTALKDIYIFSNEWSVSGTRETISNTRKWGNNDYVYYYDGNMYGNTNSDTQIYAEKNNITFIPLD